MRRPGRSAAAPQSASRGSSRFRKAPTDRPSVSVEVMSLAEWMATSILPSSNASSISLTKTPRAPISPKGFERSRSPAVVIGTRATSRSAFARRRVSAASSACVRASLLPRVPRRTIIALEVEQVSNGLRVVGSIRRRGRFLHPHRRQVQELGDDLARERLDGPQLLGRERGEPPLRPFELCNANRLGPGSQGCDRRHHVERPPPLQESLPL